MVETVVPVSGIEVSELPVVSLEAALVELDGASSDVGGLALATVVVTSAVPPVQPVAQMTHDASPRAKVNATATPSGVR